MHRRTFLRGLGTTLALPVLETVMPLSRLAAATAKTPPTRLAFVYVPNGANMADWTPTGTANAFELPPSLKPLEAVRSDLLVVSGLAHDKANANGDGAGDHARAAATFLTGCQARKTQGADIQIGISADQVAAARIGHHTRFSSLELGCDQAKLAGNCDSGYSCAYSFNIAWKTSSTPLPPEVDPRQLFDRLFANDDGGEVAENRALRQRYRKSILDFVMDDARSLQRKLGRTDQRKLEEYLTAVRELEQRIEKSEHFAAALPDYTKPTGIPAETKEHIRLMYDLMALAFQTDSTRVATFMVAHDGSNQPYPFIGVSDGHHDLSHHGGDEAKKAKIARINRFHVEQFAYFLQKLRSIPEGTGTLLDHCAIAYGSGIGDGNRHNHDDLPVLVAGKAGGAIKPNRHLRLAEKKPMTNLYLSMLDAAGAKVDKLGDSTGKLAGLA